MLIAEITDIHLMKDGAPAYGTIDTTRFLEQAVSTLAEMTPRPDVLLVAGDISEDGSPGSYALFREITGTLGIPTYITPGNHDAREPMRAAFLGDGYLPATGPLDYSVDLGPLRLLVLDSLLEGEVHGEIGPDRLAAFDTALEKTGGAPTLVMLHHPPFVTGTKMDKIALRDGDALGTVITRHDNVEIVLAGHFHRSLQRRWAGTLANICSSTAHQMGLDLSDRPGFEIFMEPPQIQLLDWTPERGLVVHQVPTGSFDRGHSSG